MSSIGDLVGEWTIPDVLYSGDAVTLLKEYFLKVEESDADLPIFSGAHFETFPAGRGTSSPADAFTAEDLLAVSMLSVDVPARAAIRMLGDDQRRLSEHLARIPADLDLAYAEPDHIGDGSAARRLWTLVLGYPGVGKTRASKLLARKRPRLFPVIDSVVETGVGHSSRHASFWHTLRHHLRIDDYALHKHLLTLRTQAGLPDHISALRVFDVVVWRKYRNS
jgi:hypothetical protein